MSSEQHHHHHLRHNQEENPSDQNRGYSQQSNYNSGGNYCSGGVGCGGYGSNDGAYGSGGGYGKSNEGAYGSGGGVSGGGYGSNDGAYASGGGYGKSNDGAYSSGGVGGVYGSNDGAYGSGGGCGNCKSHDGAYGSSGGGYGQSNTNADDNFGYAKTTAYGNDNMGGVGYGQTNSEVAPYYYRKEEKHYKHEERLGELGAATAGAFAMEAYGGWTSSLIWLLVLHSAQKEVRERHHYSVDIVVALYVGILLWRTTKFLWSPKDASVKRRLVKLEKIHGRLVQAAKDSDMDEIRDLLKEVDLGSQDTQESSQRSVLIFGAITLLSALTIVLLTLRWTSDG